MTPDGIHCLPIPTPFLVGRVNTYLIEDEPLTLESLVSQEDMERRRDEVLGIIRA